LAQEAHASSKSHHELKICQKDFTPLTQVVQTKTYPASCKLSLNQDKSTYTCGEQEHCQVLTCAQHCNHDKLSSKV
jgi:hypothetical protein